MNYLLDTCVLSEFTKRRPDTGVVDWLSDIDEAQVCISAVTIGEIQRGVQRLPDSQRRDELLTWLNNDLTRRFEGRVLPLDADVMLTWGALSARLEAQGKPMSAFDALIASTALCHGLILVTRNETDFQHAGIQIFNPWKEQNQ